MVVGYGALLSTGLCPGTGGYEGLTYVYQYTTPAIVGGGTFRGERDEDWQEDHPELAPIVEAVRASYLPRTEGLKIERQAFIDSMDTPQRAGMIHAFFGERAVSGKTRPMTRAGLDRRLDVGTWLDHVRARLGDVAVDGPGGEASDS